MENNVILHVRGKALSSTVTGGGDISSVVFNTLKEYVSIDNTDSYVKGIIKKYGLNDNSPVFITLVDVKNIIIDKNEDFTIAVTAGIQGPATFYSNFEHSTINVLAVLDKYPDGNALPDLFRLVTEAKSMAAFKLGLEFDGIPSPGTVSDAICVVFTGKEKIRYCGFGTHTGNEIAKHVYNDVLNAANNYFKKLNK